MRKGWVYDPHSGGQRIPEPAKLETERRILTHAEERYAGKYTRIEVRFHSHFCYIDAYTEPWAPEDFDEELFRETRDEHLDRLRNTPIHLCRLRYLGDQDAWSMAFYTYSHERYEPCVFDTGSFTGTPEAAFDTSAVYLTS
jgi:hypothetical protein